MASTAAFFLIAQCLSRGIDIVFEQNGARKKATDFRTGKSLGSKDHIISLNKPTKRPDWMAQTDYDTYPDTIEIREFKAHHKIVVTTLLDAKIFSKDDLASLYRSRWHVELDLRNIKSVMGMETLSCKTPEMAEKEAWVYFLAYNLVRILMAEGAHHADVTPRQLSFKHTLQTWLSWRAIAGHTQDFESGFQKIIEILAEQRVGNRTGRVEPRAVKRRPKPYSLLMKTRREAREDILKHGHPPKQRPWTPQKAAA